MAGVTLVELMVSLAIGAVLIFGATQVYVDSRNAYSSNEALARLQETARFAMAIIEPDVRMAGYLGLTKGAENIVNETAYNGTLGTPAKVCGDAFIGDFENSLQGANNEYGLGYDNTTKKAGCDSLTNFATGSSWTTSAVNSADTLVVRRASISAITKSPSCSNSDATLPFCNTVQVCATRTRAYLFHDGAVPSGCTAPSFPAGKPEQSSSFIYNVVVDAFYIDKNSLQGGALPSLRRKYLANSGSGGNPIFYDMEVVNGVEDMQLEYGVETAVSATTGTFSGVASRYVDGKTAQTIVSAGGQIVSVRIWLMVRSDTPETGYWDNRTYEYADRSSATGTASDLGAVSAAGKAFKPSADSSTALTNLARYRRLLVSRTIQLRNASGT